MGHPFARRRVDRIALRSRPDGGLHDRSSDTALPSSIDVEVRDEDGKLVASAHELRGPEPTPMALLQIDGKDIVRTTLAVGRDLGTPVILPGGEVGILTAWWHSPDHSEWRWSIELSNHR